MPLSKASTILVRGYRGLLTRWIQLALLDSVAMEPISLSFNTSHCQTNSPLHVTKTFSEGYGFHARACSPKWSIGSRQLSQHLVLTPASPPTHTTSPHRTNRGPTWPMAKCQVVEPRCTTGNGQTVIRTKRHSPQSS